MQDVVTLLETNVCCFTIGVKSPLLNKIKIYVLKNHSKKYRAFDKNIICTNSIDIVLFTLYN